MIWPRLLQSRNQNLLLYLAFQLNIKTMGGLVDNPHKQVWALHDGKVYQLLYMAHPYDYENHVSAFEKMVESFQFTR
jgi:hypothetical protein